MRILGVHGVGNYRPGEPPEQAAGHLSSIWATALGPSTDAPAVRVAYYADLLRHPGRQGGADSLDVLDDFEQELVQAWLDELELPEGVAAGPGTWPLRQAVAWIARTRFPGKKGTEWFVATFFREVAAYVRDPDGPQRAAARARVTTAIAEHRPQVVIAHSLGSVVAYEALWELPETPVELLVTLGSPLALPHAVFPRLQPAPQQARGARPPGVRRWVNLADPGDLVALPPGGIRRGFADVDTDEHTVIHGFDFHLVKNYLASAGLRRALRDQAAGQAGAGDG
ncbi:hypothetical protein [Streptomyces sp. NPDC001530]|uniref:hypothetical protein n=1 Tax=Streptomyces sp. NPDC001530 TaxID=3364582 RepID=UPI0036A365DD